MNQQNSSQLENIRQQNIKGGGMQNRSGFHSNPYIDNRSMMMNENSTNLQNPYYNKSVNQLPNTQQTKSVTDSLLGSFDTENFVKGALIGAVGAYLLTNEKAQKTIFKGIAKTTNMFQASIEEIKERFEDAQAELEAEREA